MSSEKQKITPPTPPSITRDRGTDPPFHRGTKGTSSKAKNRGESRQARKRGLPFLTLPTRTMPRYRHLHTCFQLGQNCHFSLRELRPRVQLTFRQRHRPRGRQRFRLQTNLFHCKRETTKRRFFREHHKTKTTPRGVSHRPPNFHRASSVLRPRTTNKRQHTRPHNLS